MCLPQNLKNGLVTEFPKKLKMQQTGQSMHGCNGQSRGIVTQQRQWKTIHVGFFQKGIDAKMKELTQAGIGKFFICIIY